MKGRLKSLLTRNAKEKDDRGTYKWLLVANDFGHRDALQYIEDHCEHSGLRYDDEGFERAAAHWELGVSYLNGLIKTSRRLKFAKKHLEEALDHFELSDINEGTGEDYSAEAALAQLEGKAAVTLRNALEYGANPFRKAIRRLRRLQRLHDLGHVPAVIIENEAELLNHEIQMVMNTIASSRGRT